MEYIYAAMLLHKAGKNIDESAVTKILNAAEIKVDPARVKSLVAVLSEVDINEAIKNSTALMTAPATSQASQPKAETEKPAEKEEEKARAMVR